MNRLPVIPHVERLLKPIQCIFILLRSLFLSALHGIFHRGLLQEMAQNGENPARILIKPSASDRWRRLWDWLLTAGESAGDGSVLPDSASPDGDAGADAQEPADE